MEKKVTYDGTIHLGHVLNFLGVIFAGVAIYVGLVSEVVTVKVQQENTDKTIAELKQADIQIRQEQKADNIEIMQYLRRIEEKLDRKVDK